MQGWGLILELVTTLAAAIVAGAVCERLKLGSTIGYILAGVLIGPSAIGLVQSQDTVNALAELGIALALFSAGIEFSLPRLKKLGKGVLKAGVAQLLLCLLGFAAIALAFGEGWRAALAIGAIASVSSTVIVLRILRQRGELDTSHGKVSFGILLIQDIALVPLVLLIALLGGKFGGTIGWSEVFSSTGTFVLVVTVFLLVLTRLLPRAFQSSAIATVRELPVLLALVTCIGAGWAAHAVGMSPSLGAFIAGLLLAETPVAIQIQSDLGPLRAVFGTMFFASVGMLADVRWIGERVGFVFLTAVALIAIKALLNFVAIRTFKRVTVSSAAAAFTLAQVGELGFILIQASFADQVINADQRQWATSVVLLSMLAAPTLIRVAPRLSRKVCDVLHLTPATIEWEEQSENEGLPTDHFVVYGFGTAGRTVAKVLAETSTVIVVDIDPKFARAAKSLGAIPIVGDATRLDLIEQLNLGQARALIVALPDYRSSSLAISLARHVAFEVPIVARARNHQFIDVLKQAGATTVIGEEALLGRRLGEEALKLLRIEENAAFSSDR